MQTQDSATAARIKRGIELVGNVERHGDLYTVESSDGGFWYTVNLDNANGETCECKDWQRHGFGHVCKHIVACTVYAARAACRPTARPKIIRH